MLASQGSGLKLKQLRNLAPHLTFSAKKAAMEQIVGILDSGPVPPSTLRNLIRSHVPPNVPIAASDLHNFRVRALAYSLKEKRLDPDDVKKLLKFEELEQD